MSADVPKSRKPDSIRSTISPSSPSPAIPASTALPTLYQLALAAHGHQDWWPGDTAFEVCVGAILVQNTSWTNVERAIDRLQTAGALELHGLLRVSPDELADLIRPAGYYNQKARRLRIFARVVRDQYGADLTRLFDGPTAEVRRRLLALEGIGPETADSMLLYAGGHASFVVDAYTRRIFHRHGWCAADEPYDRLQALCERFLGGGDPTRRLDYWQDYHAQLVRLGKDHCRKAAPRCEACPVRSLLPATGPVCPRRCESHLVPGIPTATLANHRIDPT